VNSRALHSHLLQACRDDGVAIIESSVEAVEPGGGGWTLHTAVDTQSPNKVEKISADRLLVAAGAWSQQLGKLLQLSFPVEPVKGQLMRVDLPEKTLGCIVHRHEFYIAPRTGQGVIIGATMEEKGFDTELNESVFEEYFEMAAEVLPALSDQKIAEKWAGLRPRPIDGQPILGDVAATLVPESPPLFVATGHFRNGILLTPITGALLADRITESNAHAALYHSIDFSPFAPDRFISAPIN
jgi:glycine oxidase